MKELELLDISNEEYHKDNGYYSSSQLVSAYQDLEVFYKKYITKTHKENFDKPHFKIGTAFHTKLLEPEKYDDEVIIFKGRRFGQIWDAFAKTNKDKIILSPLDLIAVNNLVASVEKYKFANEYLSQGLSEQSIFGNFGDIKRKARADKMLKDHWIMDLKSTTGVLNSLNIQKTIAKRCYDLSAAWYLDLYNKAGFNLNKFVWIFSSKDYPSCKIVESTPEMIENGRRKYLIAIKNIKKLKEKGFKFEEKVLRLKPIEYDLVPSELGEF